MCIRDRVMRRARRRLALDANGPPRQIQAGGDFEGRPGEYALSRLNYYLCETCETPYFGGDRARHRGGVESCRFRPESARTSRGAAEATEKRLYR